MTTIKAKLIERITYETMRYEVTMSDGWKFRVNADSEADAKAKAERQRLAEFVRETRKAGCCHYDKDCELYSGKPAK
jgi:hypothetical protein